MLSPITGKEMELQNKMSEVSYRFKIIPYLHTYYYCKDSGEEFTTTELDTMNMERIKAKYKILTKI